MDGQQIFACIYVPLAIGFCWWFVITRINAQFKREEESMRRMAEKTRAFGRERHSITVSLHGEPEVKIRRRDAVMATRAKRA